MTPKTDSFPSGPQALWLLLALFLIEYLIGSALYDARSTLGLNRAEISALTVVLANGLLLSTVMHLARLGYSELFHPSSASVAATLLLLLPPVCMLVPALLMGMDALVNALVAIAPMSAWEESMFRQMASGGLASAAAVCLLAPVLEEMLFRGVILRGFLKRYPRWQAIAGSALLFGLAHLNLYQFFVGLVLGLLSGWLYERSRSLWPCIVLHGAYNSALWVMSSLTPDAESTAVAQPAPAAPGAWTMALALAALGLFWLHRCLGARQAA
jgi:uncharacterized protein